MPSRSNALGYAQSANQFSPTRTKNYPLVLVGGNRTMNVEAEICRTRSSDWPEPLWAQEPFVVTVLSTPRSSPGTFGAQSTTRTLNQFVSA